jgi:hypothetical protein
LADYGPVAEPQPVLRGDDPLPTAFWSLTASGTNTYQAATTQRGVTNNKQWMNVWENETGLAFVAGVATVETTSGSYTVTNQTNASDAVTGTS